MNIKDLEEVKKLSNKRNELIEYKNSISDYGINRMSNKHYSFDLCFFGCEDEVKTLMTNIFQKKIEDIEDGLYDLGVEISNKIEE